MIGLALVVAFAATTRAATTEWPPSKEKESIFTERRLEIPALKIRGEPATLIITKTRH
jgi:hypothetical protein